jgi:hypothetical protein
VAESRGLTSAQTEALATFANEHGDFWLAALWRAYTAASAVDTVDRTTRAFGEVMLRQYDRLVATHQTTVTGTLLVVQDYQMEALRSALAQPPSPPETQEHTAGHELRARLAALTEVHEFYEFDATTEEQFDTWLHERIKEVRGQLGLGASGQPEAVSRDA